MMMYIYAVYRVLKSRVSFSYLVLLIKDTSPKAEKSYKAKQGHIRDVRAGRAGMIRISQFLSFGLRHHSNLIRKLFAPPAGIAPLILPSVFPAFTVSPSTCS